MKSNTNDPSEKKPINATFDVYDCFDYNDLAEMNIVHTTRKILTQYERVKLIGTRAEQLARGAIPTIVIEDGKVFDPLKIAEEELKQRTMPFMIRRRLSNGTFEILRLKDLED